MRKRSQLSIVSGIGGIKLASSVEVKRGSKFQTSPYIIECVDSRQ